MKSAFTTITDMQRVMTLMYTSINVITHSFINYKKALKQMLAIKTTVLSTDAIASEWPKIICARPRRASHSNSPASKNSCFQVIQGIHELRQNILGQSSAQLPDVNHRRLRLLRSKQTPVERH